MAGTGYLMVLYTEGLFVFIRKDYKFEINGRTYSFGLKSSEKIVHAAGGVGGIVVTTNENAYYYPNIIDSVEPEQVPLNLQDFGINNENISRIEVSTIPVIYLTNNSVYVYKKPLSEPEKVEETEEDAEKNDEKEEEEKKVLTLYPGCTE